MNKLLACTAAFSLALLACTDDNVSGTLPVTGDVESSSATVPASSETIPASSATAPESSAATLASSTSVESSSAMKPASSATIASSSSVSVSPQPMQLHASCLNDAVYVEDIPAKSYDVAPASAYKFYTPAGIPVLGLKATYLDIPCDKEHAASFIKGIDSGDESMAGLTYSISGDTLYANLSRNKRYSYSCSCTADVSFAFEEGKTYVQYVVFEHNKPLMAPELHYILESSSSEVPASSAAVASSSSVTANGRQVVTNAAANCIEKDPSENRDDLNDGIRGYAIPPVAYMELGSDSVTFVLERVRFSCDMNLTSLDVSMSGDTVVVKTSMVLENAQSDCICPTRLTFKVKADEAFKNAKLLIVDDDKNAFNKMRVIEYDGKKYESRPSQLDKDGYSRSTCLENQKVPDAATNGLPEALLVVYEDGRTVLDMNYVEDYCDIDAKVSQKVVGDTLFIEYYDEKAVSECVCTFLTHKFIIDLDNTGAKYVKFRSVVYRIVQETYTKIPNWDF